MALIHLTRTPAGLQATGPQSFSARAGYGASDSASWTFRDSRFEAAADRLGLVAVYYCEIPGGVLCADNIAELLRAGAPCRLDRIMVALSHGMGFCPGDLTIFDSIKRLPAAATLRVTDTGVEVSGAPQVPAANRLAFDDALDAYGAILERSLATLATNLTQAVVPLSGGRDSRHVLFAARAIGLEVEALTFENFPPTAKDVTAAQAVCKRLGCPHTVLKNSEYDYHRSLVRALPELGFELLEHGWIWSLVPPLARIGRPFLDGLGGDTLSNALYFSLEGNRRLRAGDAAAAARPFEQSALNDSRVGHLLTASEIERLRHIVRTEMLRWQAWPNPLVAFVFFNRTRRGAGAAPLAIARLAGVPVLLPYLELETFDFLVGLDEAFFERPGFHDAAIAKRYPLYAGLSYGSGKRSARLGYSRSVRNALAYLAPRPHLDGLKGDGRARWIGLLRILFGGDFFEESWRFQDYDLARAAARTLGQVQL